VLVISGVEPTDTETGVESSEFLKSGTGEYLTSLARPEISIDSQDQGELPPAEALS
jgi:hypothetical protein